MAGYVLEMEKIVKKFPGTIALKNVDLNLKQGEVLALIGENGAGKSTLMNVLMGNLIADEGKILYKGREMLNKTPLDALKNGIAMVPQELNLAQELTVAENISWVRISRKKVCSTGKRCIRKRRSFWMIWI